jgi:tetratricopeptide (TPR) repeat protein
MTRHGRRESAPAVEERHPGSDRTRTTAIGIATFLITLAVFSPALCNDFVDWDDPAMVLDNPNFRGLAAAQLYWMFTTFHMGHYQPLSWITLALDYRAGQALFGNGLDPRPYHLTNVALHAANAAFIYLLARRLLGGAARGPWLQHGAAALVALLTSLHPLRVESVAWVTERRDVLSSFFLLLMLLAYLRAALTSRSRWLVMAVVAYLLSLLSRAMGVTLPLILLLLDWYPLRRIGGWAVRPARVPLRRILLEKLLFLVPAVGAAILAPLAQHAAGATAGWEYHGGLARAAQACFGLAFYVWKTVLPLRLSPIYEMHVPIDPLAPRYVAAAAIVLVAAAGLVLLRRRIPGAVVALASYAIVLLPVAGFVQSGNQEAADRYSYLPAIALTMLVGAALLRTARVRRRAYACFALAAMAVVALAAATWRQCGVWQNTATLWRYAAAVSPDSSIAQNGYGWVLLQEKRYEEALARLRRAIEIQPTNPKAHNNIWMTLREQGRSDELLAAYRESIRVYPTFADAYYHLGNELRRRGQTDEAIASFRQATELRPAYASARINLAYLLNQRGQTEEALQQYELAVQADPRSALARRGLASVLKRLGHDGEAIAQLHIVLQLDPNDVTAREWLAAWTGGGMQERDPDSATGDK